MAATAACCLLFSSTSFGFVIPSHHSDIQRAFRSSARSTPVALAPDLQGDTLEQIDVLHKQKRFQEIYSLIQPLSGGPFNIDVAWRYARVLYELAEETADKSERERLVRSGLAKAEEALVQCPDNGLAHKWVGIMLGAVGQFLPTKEKVANAFRIKDTLERAATLRPEDASVKIALGEWAYKVADISWVERNAAKVLFGAPPEASYRDALELFERAYELDATKKAAIKAGLTCQQLKQTADATRWMQQALATPGTGDADAELDQIAKRALAS